MARAKKRKRTAPSGPTNMDRALCAHDALSVYGLKKEGSARYDTPESMATDLITDLMHLIQMHGGDPIQRIDVATTNFSAELEGID